MKTCNICLETYPDDFIDDFGNCSLCAEEMINQEEMDRMDHEDEMKYLEELNR